jgi:hypothetical protein
MRPAPRAQSPWSAPSFRLTQTHGAVDENGAWLRNGTLPNYQVARVCPRPALAGEVAAKRSEGVLLSRQHDA